jgi:hypothetical protein
MEEDNVSKQLITCLFSVREKKIWLPQRGQSVYEIAIFVMKYFPSTVKLRTAARKKIHETISGLRSVFASLCFLRIPRGYFLSK